MTRGFLELELTQSREFRTDFACPNNTMCDEYLLYLENHFQLGTTVNAAVSRRYH